MRALFVALPLLAALALPAGAANVSGQNTYTPGSSRLTSSGQYAATAQDYDGANDYLTRGAGLTGIADGKQGTISLWLRIDGSDGIQQDIFRSATTLGGTTLRFCLFRSTTNKIEVVGFNTAGTAILDLVTSNSYVSGATWLHILSSWDLATAGARHIYINDVSDLSVVTFTNDTIDYTQADWAIGATPNGARKVNGCLSEIYFSTAYIDLSVTANRRRFITAANKPAKPGYLGQRPQVSVPFSYHPAGDEVNRGSGGSSTVTGALTACSTVPSS